jgi:Fe2+ transport system protein B
MDAAAGRRVSASGGGPLLFLAVVVAIFQTIFTVAAPSQTAVDWLIRIPATGLQRYLPQRSFQIAGDRRRVEGRGSVIVFLPQICCCSCSSAFWRIPATWRARR